MVEVDPREGQVTPAGGLESGREARSEEEHEISSDLTPSALAATRGRRALVLLFSSDPRWLACVFYLE